MSIIQRDRYLLKLTEKQWNGRVKIVTGIRRCGKSFLLSHLYKNHLIESGVSPDNILEVALDRKEFEALRNPDALYEFVLDRVTTSNKYYVFIDEIQLSYKIKRKGTDETLVAPEDRDLLYTTFYDVLNDLIARENLDVYVTGSNSKMLSSDIVTNFRDRGSEIHMWPLSFSEYHSFSGKEKADAWADYLVYGGMPTAVLESNERDREEYLKGLFEKVYVADIVERYNIEDKYVLDSLMNAVASSIGSLTNPTKLANTLNTVAHAKTTDKTIKKYLDALEDAFILSKAERFDVKGKRYFDYPMKFYATDVGLRNARLNFRQIEETHLMENILFNELSMRGYSVDVGAIRFSEKRNGKPHDAMHEIDFVIHRGSQKIYIQSALSLESEEKLRQETAPLLKSGDFFKKMVVVGGSRQPWTDENGIIFVGVIPFLLDESILDA